MRRFIVRNCDMYMARLSSSIYSKNREEQWLDENNDMTGMLCGVWSTNVAQWCDGCL